MQTAPAKYAVIFKTYTWDDFIERQARRCREAVKGGDFYISFDTTSGDAPAICGHEVMRTSNAALIAAGWSNRVEHKSLLWWNADYPHYQFQRTYPQYDFYVFVEYDALFLGSWDEVIAQLATDKIDFAAFPLRVPLDEWHWAQRHALTYSRDQIQGCLMSISIQSRKALEALGERRQRLAREDVPYWPSAEVFMATEARRLELLTTSLDRFADARHFDWHPPCLEEEAIKAQQPAFLHPVYDRQRFLRWCLAHTATFVELLQPKKPVLQNLSRMPVHVFLAPYAGLVWKALLTSLEQRTRQLLLMGEPPFPS